MAYWSNIGDHSSVLDHLLRYSGHQDYSSYHDGHNICTLQYSILSIVKYLQYFLVVIITVL